jgi:hypothetical protein
MKLTLKKKITYKAFSYCLETLTKKNALPTLASHVEKESGAKVGFKEHN